MWLAWEMSWCDEATDACWVLRGVTYQCNWQAPFWCRKEDFTLSEAAEVKQWNCPSCPKTLRRFLFMFTYILLSSRVLAATAVLYRYCISYCFDSFQNTMIRNFNFLSMFFRKYGMALFSMSGWSKLIVKYWNILLARRGFCKYCRVGATNRMQQCYKF